MNLEEIKLSIKSSSEKFRRLLRANIRTFLLKRKEIGETFLLKRKESGKTFLPERKESGKVSFLEGKFRKSMIKGTQVRIRASCSYNVSYKYRKSVSTRSFLLRVPRLFFTLTHIAGIFKIYA